MPFPSSTASLFDPTSAPYKKAKRQHLKATKNRPHDIEAEWSPFRAAEKRYKARFPPPDLSQVLDLAALDSERADEIRHGIWTGKSDAVEHKQISSRNGKRVYIVPRIPGLIILPGFVSPNDQRQLVRWALERQASFPNETNLDIHYSLPKEGVWNRWLREVNCLSKEFILPKALNSDVVDRPIPGPRQLINNAPASINTFHAISSTLKISQAPSPTMQPMYSSELLYKLRWANIGWFYHWGTKQYDFTKGKGTIDGELREVCKSAVQAIDWKEVYGDSNADWGDAGPEWKTWNQTYEPDAGIVNFYQTKDTLMAHVDRSEVCATSPLVSVSLGNAAVFLIGGLTRDVEPVPILLRSGDVVIMSGPACRRAYHGVPRILEGSLPQHLRQGNDDADWQFYEDYLLTTRININARQVFPIGFNPL